MTRTFSFMFFGVMLVMSAILISPSFAQIVRKKRGHVTAHVPNHHTPGIPYALFRRKTESEKTHDLGSKDATSHAYGFDNSNLITDDLAGGLTGRPGISHTPDSSRELRGQQGSDGQVSALQELNQSTAASRPASAGCTFTSFSQLSVGKLSQCKSVILSSIAVPAGKTLDLSKLSSGTTVTFAGETTFGHAVWKGPLILVSGSNIHVTGAPGSVLNGSGARWWDGLGEKGPAKPKFFAAHKMVNSKISYLTIKDTPVQAFSINLAKTLVIDHVKVDSSAGNVGLKARNTDAFDVGSSDGVVITNAWVHNQDDCLAINSGTNIVFDGGTCIGGHGLSIGSVGGRDNNKVHGVRIANSHVADSDHAIRIKTIAGATGSVSNVIYESITMSGIRQDGIVIEQDYLDGGPTGRPTGGVPITDLTLSNISGQVNPSANNKHILCANGSCKGWKISNLRIHGGKQGACTGSPLLELCSLFTGTISSSVQARSRNAFADHSAYSDSKEDSSDYQAAYIDVEDDSESLADPAFLGGGRGSP